MMRSSFLALLASPAVCLLMLLGTASTLLAQISPEVKGPYKQYTVPATYAKYLLDEFLPVIEARVNVTKNPTLRVICGMSLGGICAYGVNWHRPDSLHWLWRGWQDQQP